MIFVKKIFKYRFIFVTLLSLATIIFVGNLYYKSIYELSLLSKAKDGLFHKRTHVSEKQLKHFGVTDNFNDIDNDDVNNNNYVYDITECTVIEEANATIITEDEFSNFGFDADWIKKRAGIWQDDFETRYEKQKKDASRLPLKVFILPHSHNDPGWLKTFVGYYDSQTKKILDAIVTKLTEFKDMRFVWTEISFLDLWWQEATAEQRDAFKKLVKEGRLEIMTGGWVMTDEANVHLYAMLDQLIEGHQWVKSKLDVKPKVGWSIDPFGQGSSVPHLLAKSGFDGAIIQRIHYNWKEWFARHQSGDFYWKSHWHTPRSSEYTLLTHNMPFDIYSTHHSCGPNPNLCDNFDFNSRVPNFKSSDIAQKADIMVKQYEKTASLFPHNVAFVLVGGDFTYDNLKVFDNQHTGYRQLIDYINSNSEKYNGASLQFGTPSDYFNEIKKRQKENFPSLIGDFFPYSDIFSSGVPAYWTGYFSTRPFYKYASRELEHNLRNAEILFTIAYNKAKQLKFDDKIVKNLEKSYEKIVEARRNLGLFQHHDAITGTSKLAVMKDYLGRLQKSIKDVINIQQTTIEFFLQSKDKSFQNDFIIHELDRVKFDEWPKKRIVQLSDGKIQQVVLLNSLVQNRIEVVSIHVSSPNVHMIDSKGKAVKYQVNPTFDSNGHISNEIFELNFLVKLPPMSISVYHLTYNELESNSVEIYCKNCNKNKNFEISQIEKSDSIEIENSEVKLIFDEYLGLLKSIKHAEYDESNDISIEFGSYKSFPRKSGSYLFKPDLRNPSYSNNTFDGQPEVRIYIQKGSIASDVTIIRGDLLAHTVRVFITDTHLDNAIAIKNVIDFGNAQQNRDKEMFMKIKSSINNMKNENVTEFFTDLNGFQYQPRRLVPKLEIEGNYYPITSSIFIQDELMRMSLMTTHAQGATSWKRGEIEVMLDRRITNDDGRGMGEGVYDNVKMEHKFWLTLEYFPNLQSDENVAKKYQVPSLFVQYLTNSLNYPVNSYFIDGKNENQLKIYSEVKLLHTRLPCDYHLINIRSLTDNKLEWLPSQNALLIFHRLGYDCELTNEVFSKQICGQQSNFNNIQFLNDLKIKTIQKTSLTALDSEERIKSFRYESLDLMELRTYNVTFA